MLKTTKSTGFAINSKETESKVGSDSVISNLVSDSKATNPTKGKNQVKMAKFKILIKSKNHDFLKSKTKEAGPGFFNPKARLAFTQLRQAFVKALILHHFDPESHIWIETDALGYAIGGILSQLSSGTRPDGVLTKDDLSQWYLVAFFSRKMIFTETRYKTYNGELLAIVKAFKTWQHYLEGCKHKILILTDHNNLRRFMDTKNLRSKQVHGAQELSCYHFCINY